MKLDIRCDSIQDLCNIKHLNILKKETKTDGPCQPDQSDLKRERKRDYKNRTNLNVGLLKMGQADHQRVIKIHLLLFY